MQGASFDCQAAPSCGKVCLCNAIWSQAAARVRAFKNFAWLGIALLAGCSYQAAALDPVEIDASAASSGAIELYDKDGDGAIAGAELNAVPGIKKHLNMYDRDGDQRVTRDEIAERFAVWASNPLAIMGSAYVVTLDGKPLSGATMTFVPEPYLEPNVKPATGDTTEIGLTRPSHAPEHLPKTANGKTIYGMTSGTFKIQITHPSQKIPAKYNTQTELGDEVAHDINPTGAPLKINLTSR
jgi:hypothetical protein